MGGRGRQIGMRVEELVKADANENAYGTPEEVKRAVSAAAANFHIYPG